MSHYPKEYGAWAGNPKGQAPDFTRCCTAIWSKERWSRESQCSRPRGFGPDKAYCKQHDPEVAKARREASNARGQERWQQRLIEVSGRTFYDALTKIAEGHNDARGLAQEVLRKFRGDQ